MPEYAGQCRDARLAGPGGARGQGGPRAAVDQRQVKRLICVIVPRARTGAQAASRRGGLTW